MQIKNNPARETRTNKKKKIKKNHIKSVYHKKYKNFVPKKRSISLPLSKIYTSMFIPIIKGSHRKGDEEQQLTSSVLSVNFIEFNKAKCKVSHVGQNNLNNE